MRAIDLYAGIGGWTLGLELAGIEVVASYEWWQPAIDTHNGNHGGRLAPVDIRKLQLRDLAEDIDLVVGSPPCTQFSYANRGGSGDLAEGLKDLVKFFEVVDHLQPKFWAMENVPRVATLLRHGFATKGHPLYRFRHLKPNVDVFDFSEYGTPQARRRCIATNIPLDQIRSFRDQTPRLTLGDVVTSLGAKESVIDPVWGVALPVEDLTETAEEPPLNAEELRMNRDAKEHHPVYNNMAFPDPLGKPARTVTATCTRVSRESIIIADPREAGRFRRLTIRERASLQGFPVTYQFFARSFGEKAKMIGNAIPPTFTYLVALIALGVPASNFEGFTKAGRGLRMPSEKGPSTSPDAEGKSYPAARVFRAALPGFRFKSGMRFDLANSTDAAGVNWAVRFYFGPSKDIRQIELDGSVTQDLLKSPLMADILTDFKGRLAALEGFLGRTDSQNLQLAWTHRVDGIGPYDVTDRLAEAAESLYKLIDAELDSAGRLAVARYIVEVATGIGSDAKLVNKGKLQRNSVRVLAGIVIGDWFNNLPWHKKWKEAA